MKKRNFLALAALSIGMLSISCKKEETKTSSSQETSVAEDTTSSGAFNAVFKCGDKELIIETVKLDSVDGVPMATVKVTLPDGKVTEMKEQKAASGYWFANDTYDLHGKGDSVNVYDVKTEKKLFENCAAVN